MSQPNAATVLLDGIRNVLGRSAFEFRPDYVSILSGNDEAKFSWITVNTVLGKLAAKEYSQLKSFSNFSGNEYLSMFLYYRVEIDLKLNFVKWISFSIFLFGFVAVVVMI